MEIYHLQNTESQNTGVLPEKKLLAAIVGRAFQDLVNGKEAPDNTSYLKPFFFNDECVPFTLRYCLEHLLPESEAENIIFGVRDLVNKHGFDFQKKKRSTLQNRMKKNLTRISWSLVPDDRKQDN